MALHNPVLVICQNHMTQTTEYSKGFFHLVDLMAPDPYAPFIHTCLALHKAKSKSGKYYISCKYFLTNRTAKAPSPTADDMPAKAPALTSPAANIPGMDVSVI